MNDLERKTIEELVAELRALVLEHGADWSVYVETCARRHGIGPAGLSPERLREMITKLRGETK